MAQLKNTTISDTGFILLPSGTTAERPAAAAGKLRFNSSNGRSEFANAQRWANLEDKLEVGTIGSPARSAEQLVGKGSGNYYVKIHDTTYLMAFDDSDKFGTGVVGWLHISNTFIGNNNSLVSFHRQATDHDASFTNAATGVIRIGNSTWNADGALGFSMAQIQAPAHRYFACDNVQMQFAGGNSFDDGTSWPAQHDAFQINSMVAKKRAVINNGQGAVIGHWDGNVGAIYQAGINLVKQGGEYGNNLNVTQTFSGAPTDFGRIADRPYIFSATTDQADEYYDLQIYGFWVH